MILCFYIVIIQSRIDSILAIDILSSDIRVLVNQIGGNHENEIVFSYPYVCEVIPTQEYNDPLKNIHFEDFTLNWIESVQNYPGTSYMHLDFFLGKVSTPDLLSCIQRRYKGIMFSKGIGNKIMLCQYYPESVFVSLFRRIIEDIIGKGYHPVDLRVSIPQFWSQNQKKSLWFVLKQLNTSFVLVNSSSTICAYLFQKNKFIFEHSESKILFIEICDSFSQVFVTKYVDGSSVKKNAKQIFYAWNDTVGLYDIDLCVKTLLTKHIKNISSPHVEKVLYQEASKIREGLSHSSVVTGIIMGQSYQISRNDVRKCVSIILSSIDYMLMSAIRSINLDSIDRVYIFGPGSQFFAISELISSIFPENKIEYIPENEMINLIGTQYLSNLVFDNINVNNFFLVVNGINVSIHQDYLSSDGWASLVYSSSHLPIGIDRIIKNVTVDFSTRLVYKWNNVFSFKNHLNKSSSKWKQVVRSQANLLNKKAEISKNTELTYTFLVHELNLVYSYLEENHDENSFGLMKNLADISKKAKKALKNNRYGDLLSVREIFYFLTNNIMSHIQNKKLTPIVFNELQRECSYFKSIIIDKFRETKTHHNSSSMIRTLAEVVIWTRMKKEKIEKNKNSTYPTVFWTQIKRQIDRLKEFN